MSGKAPQKLIYLLSRDERHRVVCTLNKARLLNWREFRPLSLNRLAQLLTPTQYAQLTKADRSILPRLVQYERAGQCEAVLADEDGFTLLKDIVSSGRAFLADGNQLRVKWDNIRPADPCWKDSPSGIAQPTFETAPGTTEFFATTPPCYLDRSGRFDCIGPIRTEWPKPTARAWLSPPLADEAAMNTFLGLFINRYHVVPPSREGTENEDLTVDCPPVPVIRIVREGKETALSRGKMHALDELLLLRLFFRYGTKEVPWNDDRERIAFKEDGRLRCCLRNTHAEQAIVNRLRSYGFAPKPPSELSLFDFHANDFQLQPTTTNRWDDLIQTGFPELRREGWDVTHDKLFDFDVVAPKQWLRRTEPQDGGKWHMYEVGISYRNRTIPILPLLRDFLRSNTERSNDELVDYFERTSFAVPAGKEGKLLLVPGKWLRPLFEHLFELGFSKSLDRQGRLPISRWRASEIALEGDLLTTDASTKDQEGSPSLHLLRQRLSTGADDFAPPADLPKGLEDLRDYQRTGLGWLDFLRKTETGGILADDMGLGKTFQVLAHLSHEKEQGRLDAPALIVCPTSVIDNWIQEAQRRTPNLRVHRYHGPQRKSLWNSAIANSDAIVTSYPLLREDQEQMGAAGWSIAILDEAQAIKNRQSQLFQVAMNLDAKRRLCITGTPIENHLGELWTLFQFLSPYYLGNYEQFRENFLKPLDQAKANPNLAQARAQLLSRRISPFILRRKKEAVARELPSKTEITHTVEFGSLQAQKYEAMRLHLVKEIHQLLEERSLAQSQIHVLEALLRLRMICCDPRLGSDGDSNASAEHSAKLERLFQLLEELLEEGRRILVFSQFVGMLGLIESEITRRGWSCLKLTGQSRERGKLVEAFNQGESPIFLISLKAGGSGLNLASADTVIHYDPWWNPAVEAQATDRAHRIGQDKPVFVHRLIARGTVEEGILRLHERKRELVENILDGLPGDRLLLDKETLEALFGEAF